MNDALMQQLEKINCVLHEAFLPDCSDTVDRALQPIALLSAPCASLLASGGKRWRPLLMTLSYKFAGGTSENIYTLAPLIEGIHTASLIHDDIEDNSDLRRGKPTAHIAYGLDTALNAGSWLYFQALEVLEGYHAPSDIKLDLYTAAISRIRALHEGQALDIYWHNTADFFPSQQDYIRMIRLKTGELAALAAYIGMRSAEKPHEQAQTFASLFSNAGVAFQILDDVKNISKGNAGKKRGDDIVEGKKSFPVLLHIEKHPEDTVRFTAYFKKAQKEGIVSPAVGQAITLLHESGSISEAEKQGKDMLDAVLSRVAAWYGRDAQQIFQNLFDLMQGT